MEFGHMRKLIIEFKKIRTIFYVAGLVGTVLGVRTFNQLPLTKLVATITPSQKKSASRSALSHNLSVWLECVADPSRNCLQIHKLQFPGTEKPQVKSPEPSILGEEGEPKEIGKDDQGRNIYELEILQSLKGGQRIIVDSLILIKGKRKLENINLRNIVSLKNMEGDELLQTNMECDDQVDYQQIRLICDEKIGWLDRVALLFFFK